ncbi:MAG: 4-hydroxybenzoate octaprenyltransferase [Nitrospirales bacterium]|nr:4-hydroxybenzoate octaprenyltransferase [Nitrospira sp.]MDR4501389.1 4-hydroxybenzoate octaprenyltransferase [Nitrospirales bacterium]
MTTPPSSTTESSPNVPQQREHFWITALQLIRLPSQSGTWLLLLPSLWALVLASEKNQLDPALVLIFTIGAFLMRSAGVIFNDLADRSIDKQVQRTQHRPLARGALSPLQALSLALIFVVLSFGLVLSLNPLSIALSPIALALAALYPFAKRYIHIPQLILGIAFGWGTVMAWAAVQNRLELETWLLFLGTVFWAVAYDTIYALQDREDDVKIGVKSSAIFFGEYVWAGVAGASSLTLIFIGMAGWLASLNNFFFVGLLGISLFLSWQVWRLTQPQQRHTYFTMFKQHVWVGIAMLVLLWAGKI